MAASEEMWLHAANRGQKSSVCIKWFSLGEKQSERPQECGKWRRAKNQGVEREREKDGQKRTRRKKEQREGKRRKISKGIVKSYETECVQMGRGKKNIQGNKTLNFMRKVCIMLQRFASFRVSALCTLSFHEAASFIKVPSSCIPSLCSCSPAHVVYQCIPFFWHLKGEKITCWKVPPKKWKWECGWGGESCSRVH